MNPRPETVAGLHLKPIPPTRDGKDLIALVYLADEVLVFAGRFAKVGLHHGLQVAGGHDRNDPVRSAERGCADLGDHPCLTHQLPRPLAEIRRAAEISLRQCLVGSVQEVIGSLEANRNLRIFGLRNGL